MQSYHFRHIKKTEKVFLIKIKYYVYLFDATLLFLDQLWMHCMQTGTTWHKCLYLDVTSSLLRTFCYSRKTKELIIAWMILNRCFTIFYQNDCWLGGKPCECLIVRWFPALGTDWFIFLVNLLAWHQSRAFSLHRSKHMLAILSSGNCVSTLVLIVLESYL